jgi:hypothetical protein
MDAFEKMVQPIFFQFRCNQNESRTLVALRDTLLPKLISGELRVDGISDWSDPSDESDLSKAFEPSDSSKAFVASDRRTP